MLIQKFKRPYHVMCGIGIIGLLLAVGGALRDNDHRTLADVSGKSGQWSEHLGKGEVFPACGSSFIPSFVLPCTSPPNACGMTNSGVIQADGTCSVATPPDSSCPVPTVILHVSSPVDPTPDPVIDTGQKATLTWDSPDATSCRWTGGFAATTVGRSGSVTTEPLTDTTTFQICCAYASGVCSPPARVTVTVLNPSVDLKAEPLRVKSGGLSTVTWHTTDVRSCVITKNGAPYLAPSGTPDTITTQTTYTITCETHGDPLTKSVRVNVVPKYEEY